MKTDTKESLLRYKEHGIDPGEFLRFVLCNSLIGALNYADNDNAKDLKEIVRFVSDELPWSAWGSLEKVSAWKSQGGLVGIEEKEGMIV